MLAGDRHAGDSGASLRRLVRLSPLRGLDDLDRAVVAAYGWPADVVAEPDEGNRRLLELNRRIEAGDVEYATFSDFGAP